MGAKLLKITIYKENIISFLEKGKEKESIKGGVLEY